MALGVAETETETAETMVTVETETETETEDPRDRGTGKGTGTGTRLIVTEIAVGTEIGAGTETAGAGKSFEHITQYKLSTHTVLTLYYQPVLSKASLYEQRTQSLLTE